MKILESWEPNVGQSLFCFLGGGGVHGRVTHLPFTVNHMRRNEAWFPVNASQDVFIGLCWYVAGQLNQDRNCKPNCQIRKTMIRVRKEKTLWYVMELRTCPPVTEGVFGPPARTRRTMAPEVLFFINPEKGAFARGALRKFVANCAPNVRTIAGISFRTSEEGCTKLS